MACTATELVDAAKCYCVDDGTLDAMATYLMCQWVLAENVEAGLMLGDGSGFILLNDGGKILVS